MSSDRARGKDARGLPYAAVEHVVFDVYIPAIAAAPATPRLSGASALALYAAVCRHAMGETQDTFAGVPALSRHSGLGESTARRYLEVLRRARMIDITTQIDPDNNRQSTNLYTLLRLDPLGPPPGWFDTPLPPRDEAYVCLYRRVPPSHHERGAPTVRGGRSHRERGPLSQGEGLTKELTTDQLTTERGGDNEERPTVDAGAAEERVRVLAGRLQTALATLRAGDSMPPGMAIAGEDLDELRRRQAWRRDVREYEALTRGNR